MSGLDKLSYPEGRARFMCAPSDDISTWTPSTAWKKNLVLYQWAAIAGRLLNGAGVKYSIGGMYLEFDNSGSAVDPPPTFDRARTISYYNNMNTENSDRDYLRVPLSSTQLLSSDSSLYPDGNQCIFFSRSQGLTGVHGNQFSSDDNSVIFGASLVAFVDDTDATQDLLLSSIYFATSDQQAKLSTSQVGIEWELTLQ